MKTKIYGKDQNTHLVDLPASKLVKHQIKTFEKTKVIDGTETRLKVELRYDDQCGNGKNSFAMTADIYEKSKTGSWIDAGGGCCHDKIIKLFPEFEPLVKWHLFDSSGPMHYISNSLYQASARDCWGKLKGEPKSFKKVLRFDGFPISMNLKQGFINWLEELKESGATKSSWNPEIIEVPYVNKDGENYKLNPSYTYAGYNSPWYSCPFDTELEAKEFLEALQKFDFTVMSVPAIFGEGKEPDLKAARNCAVWPEAELKDFTENNLLERLPALMQKFKKDMELLGFDY